MDNAALESYLRKIYSWINDNIIKVSVCDRSGLCYASGVPQTTALRWVNVIEERRLISRTRDPIDGRRIYVALTERGEELMRGYLESAHKTLSG